MRYRGSQYRHAAALVKRSRPDGEVRYARVSGLTHAVRREQDEWVCSCGRRWATDEGEDHP